MPKKIVQYVEKIVEVPQVIYEERAVEVPQYINVEAITTTPKPTIQKINKEIPKYVIQAQEKIIDVPIVLTVERPVEVPMVQVAEVITQVPKAEYQYIDKQIPKITTEVREQVVEVPQVLYEERLVEVPQVQVAEFIKQVPKHTVQQVQKGIPKIQTQVVEKVVQVPVSLITETAVEVPQVQVVEVLKQTASEKQQQRIVQTGVQWQQPVAREAVVQRIEAAMSAGKYEADVVAIREAASIQPTVIERQNPVLATQETVESPVVTRTLFGTADAVAGVQEVVFQGLRIPLYEIHHLHAMPMVQLRAHAEFLYRNLGHAYCGSAVPVQDSQLHEWTIRIHDIHLRPLLTSGAATSANVPLVTGPMF